MEPLKVLEGTNGQIELFTNKAVIKRKGALSAMTFGFRGEKNIPFESITSIQLKLPGLMTAGYIQFGVLGGIEGAKGLLEATRDENTVMFNKPGVEAAEYIRNYIEQHKANKTGGGSHSLSDELRKLKALLDDGIINDAEFETQKKKLLGS